jgi:hypothetical protein
MAPAEVVDDVDGAHPQILNGHAASARQTLTAPAVSMEEQDDADQEQRLINEGAIHSPPAFLRNWAFH